MLWRVRTVVSEAAEAVPIYGFCSPRLPQVPRGPVPWLTRVACVHSLVISDEGVSASKSKMGAAERAWDVDGVQCVTFRIPGNWIRFSHSTYDPAQIGERSRDGGSTSGGGGRRGRRHVWSRLEHTPTRGTRLRSEHRRSLRACDVVITPSHGPLRPPRRLGVLSRG